MPNRADIKKSVKKGPLGVDFIRRLGAESSDELFEIILSNGMISIQIGNARQTNDFIIGLVNDHLNREMVNFVRTSNTILGLKGKLNTLGLLNGIVTANARPEGQYNAAAGDDNATKAAKWICGASTTIAAGGPIESIRSMIAEAVRVNTPMTNYYSVKIINDLCIAGGGGRTIPRGPIIAPPSPLPSSMSGAVLLKNAMQSIANRTPNDPVGWKDLGCYLLGAVVSSHGFTDANGRTARVLYAICQIKSGQPFVAPTSAGESIFNELPG